MKTIILLSVFILTFAKGQVPGTQDMSFGTNGKTEYLYDPASVKGFHGYTMNILPDNRFFVGGVSNWGCSSNQYYTGVLTKFTSNGIPDTSFGQNGANGNFGVITEIQPASDGNYLIINQYANLTKINAAGNPVTSWGTNGSISLPYEQTIRDWKETSTHEIIMTTVKRNYDNKLYTTLYKFNPDGSVQTAFGNNGKIEFGTSPNWILTNVNIDNDGNYIFTGKKTIGATYGDANIVVYKTNPQGLPIATFGTNGSLTITNYIAYDNKQHFSFLTPDNSIVISTIGKMGPASNNRCLIMKVLANGTLDSNFNNGFKYTSNYMEPISSYYIDNSFYIVGEMGNISYMIGKINSSGNVDNTYNSGGYITIPRLTGNHNGTRTMLHGDKIILAETMDNFYCAQSNWKLVMRRFSFDSFTPLSTNETTFTKNINIYPNPADNRIFLEGFDRGIELVSIDGKKIKADLKDEGKTISMDISHLIKGMYIITGKNSNGKIVSKKFFKN